MNDSRSRTARQAIDDVARWAETQGWPLPSERVEKLAAYLDVLVSWNRAFALVSRQDTPTIAVKHFADSLAAAGHCRAASRIVDVGSGAGFPGLVMAIANPASRVALVEPTGKKVSFLREVIRIATVDNAEVLQERVGSTPIGDGFDLAISRAFGPLDTFLSLARPLVGEKGVVVAMKGPSYREELDALRLERIGYAFESAEHYSLPDKSSRVLLRFGRS